MTESVSLLLMVIIGGIGTILGPILGAAFLTALPEFLRSINDWRLVIFGALLVLTIMFMPNGILGVIKSILQKLKFSKKLTPNFPEAREIAEIRKEEGESVGS